jgi:LytS/YehU family sensor histidine kinase
MALGDRYNQFKEERDKFQSELNISRLQALQNRMSPHFLFNALNTIYSMMQAGYPLAKDAVLKLSEIYHFLTDNGLKKLIFLKEELFFLDSYLEIMKLRFQERIKISMDINGSFQNTLIPPLTIQPIVENCFKHGLKKGRAAKMDIRIIIKERDDGAEIIIENTGPEINLKKINSRTLENIRQRLIFNYSEAQIQTLNIKGSGVRVLVFYSKKKG